jgi:hypothetical protein
VTLSATIVSPVEHADSAQTAANDTTTRRKVMRAPYCGSFEPVNGVKRIHVTIRVVEPVAKAACRSEFVARRAFAPLQQSKHRCTSLSRSDTCPINDDLAMTPVRIARHGV